MGKVSQAKPKEQEAPTWTRKVYHIIVSGAICVDHVHLLIYDRHPELQDKWDKAFWARGYYVATIGNLTEEAIKKYNAGQSEESRKEDSEGAAF